MFKVTILIFIPYFFLNCSSYQKLHMAGLSPLDPSSFSRPEHAKVIDLNLELTANFEKRIFTGSATLTIEKVQPNIKEVVLDSQDLNISEIYETDLNKTLSYHLADPVGHFGSELTIELPPKDSNIYVVRVSYSTDRKARGLQWLDAEQTAGKKLPYVFSQFQAIHARSFVPCQDTPGVKAPYSATITVPKDMVIVMSAPRECDAVASDKTVSKFQQKVAIPSYLIAFAIGALHSKRIGPRSHVWSEKEVLDNAAYEFEDTEKQLKAAEEICGPYVWGIYDLLVLPPSFPFGGMENPCLTFVTPTLLAGDKSLANVVAHEIAHSWTGNLITNRNFEHFWLNEGFTVFIERKIIGRLVNAKEQDFEAICGVGELKETIDQLGATNPVTSLVVDLTSIHPDDSFSRVPYEKGHLFLCFLEEVIGGPAIFEPFLRSYFDTYKYKSIDTNDFKTYFETYFAKNSSIKGIDWDSWLYKPGMPPVIPTFDNTLHKRCSFLKEQWLDWNGSIENSPFTTNDFSSLSTNQLIQFLQEVVESEPQPVAKLQTLQKIFDFDSIKNAEIKFRWLRVGIKAHWEEKIQTTLEWVSVVGRMKYVRPLYRDLYDWEKSRAPAIDNFTKQKNKMMHVVVYTVNQDLHLDE